MSIGACDSCLLASAALAAVGGVVEITAPSRRPRAILSLEPDRLLHEVRRTGGSSGSFSLDGFDAAGERQRIQTLGVASACRHRGDFHWPESLREDPEPPWVLNLLGDPSLITAPRMRVAVVGARKADPYGIQTARAIARESAAAGAVVISGLALGIDCAAHRGALEARDGLTVAVVGGGVDRPYPRSNRDVHAEIVERGCVVSEMPPGTGVWRWSFPARNRLIAAFADLVVVVQATEGSGSLHTADAALVRCIAVAAVPGRIDHQLSAGTNRLISDGGFVVVDALTPTALLGLEPDRLEAPVRGQLGHAFESVRNGSAAGILNAGGAAASDLRRDLTLLELDGLVERTPGGGWRPTR